MENLQKALNDYIDGKHTQQECVGFIDGFNKGAQLAAEDKKELLVRFLDSIRDYEHEARKSIYNDDRKSVEIVEIFLEKHETI